MPVFTAKLSDGREVELESDHEPTEAEILSAVQEHQGTALGAFGSAAARGAAPTAAFVGGAELAAPFGAPLGPLGVAGAVLIGGTLASIAAHKIQTKAADVLAPESIFGSKAAAEQQSEHPVATVLGDIASGAAALRFSPGALLRTPKKAAIAAGVGAALGTAIPLAEGEKPTVGGVLESSAFPLVYGEPRFKIGNLRPAVKLVPEAPGEPAKVAVGEKGDTHPDIIKKEGLTAGEIDKREFVDGQGNELSREQVAAMGVPTEVEAGKAHSTDLAKAQRHEKLRQLGLSDQDISDLESGQASVSDVVARKLPGEEGRGPDHAKALEEARIQAIGDIERALSGDDKPNVISLLRQEGLTQQQAESLASDKVTPSEVIKSQLKEWQERMWSAREAGETGTIEHDEAVKQAMEQATLRLRDILEGKDPNTGKPYEPVSGKRSEKDLRIPEGQAPAGISTLPGTETLQPATGRSGVSGTRLTYGERYIEELGIDKARERIDHLNRRTEEELAKRPIDQAAIKRLQQEAQNIANAVEKQAKAQEQPPPLTEAQGKYLYHAISEEGLATLRERGIYESPPGYNKKFATTSEEAVKKWVGATSKTSGERTRLIRFSSEGVRTEPSKIWKNSFSIESAVPPENIEVLENGKWVRLKPTEPEPPPLTEAQRAEEQARLAKELGQEPPPEPAKPEPPVAPEAERILNRQVGNLPKGTAVRLTGKRNPSQFADELEVQMPDGTVRYLPSDWLSRKGVKPKGTLAGLIKARGREQVDALIGEWDSDASLSEDGTSIRTLSDPRNQTGKVRASTREFLQWLADRESETPEPPAPVAPEAPKGKQPPPMAPEPPPQPAAKVEQAGAKPAKIPKKPADVPESLWANEPARQTILNHEQNIRHNNELLKQVNAQIQPLLVERGQAEQLHKGSEAQRRMGGLGPNALKAYRLNQEIKALRQQAQHIRDNTATEKKLRQNFINSWEVGEAKRPAPAPPAQGTPPEQGMAGPGSPAITQPPDPKAQIEQLTDAFRNIAGKKVPLGERLRQAFNFGSQMDQSKDALGRALNGLRGVGKAIKERFNQVQNIDDLLRAKGDLSAALEMRGWTTRQWEKIAKRATPSARDQAAIAKYVDAGGDPAKLQQGLAETKPEFKQAYQDALNLKGDLKIAAENVRNYFESRLQEAVDEGVLEHGVEDYIHRMYESRPTLAQKLVAYVQTGLLQQNPSLTKKRIFDFDWQAEKLGYKPVQSYITRIAQYESSLARAIAARQFIKKATTMKAADGRPVIDIKGVGIPIEDPLTGAREATLIKPQFNPALKNEPGTPNYRGDYVNKEFPALSRWKWVSADSDGKPIFVQGDVAIHPDYVGRVSALLEPSRIRYGRYGAVARPILNIGAAFKQTMLDLSGFHQVQVTLHGMEHRVMPWKILQDIDFNHPDVDGLLKGGVTLGGDYRIQQEGLIGSALTRHVPLLGPVMESYHNWLFRDYIPRLKMTMALHALERNKARYAGTKTPEQIYHQTASEANAAFGEQNYIMLERSKTAQDIARIIFMAPDFLEARGRFAGQALTKGGKNFGNEQRTALLLGALTMWVTARLLNKAVNGQWHDEPENAFSIVHNGKSYGLRTVQGDIMHMLTKPVSFWLYRLNPIYTRPALEIAAGRDEFGRKRSVPEAAWDTVSNIVPISLRTSRERSLAESMLNAFGINARRWNDTDKAFTLAKDWKAQHGIGERGEFIYDRDKDPLRPLKLALTSANEGAAVKELGKVIQSKAYTIPKLDEYFRRYAGMPFTGSKANDIKFKATLTDDQKQTVEAARQHKAAIAKLYFQAKHKLLTNQ